MHQAGIKGVINKLQTTIKENEDTGALEAVIRFSTTGVEPADLHRLFQAQKAGRLEFSISSQQLELFSSKESASVELPLN